MTDVLDPKTDAQAIIDIATDAARPQQLDETGRFFSVTVAAGATHQVVDLEAHLDKFRDRPRRKTGSYVVHDVPSFAAYFEKHKVVETEVWADLTTQQLFAVLNAHTESLSADEHGTAGWEDHRLSYAVKKTDGWLAWTAVDGKLLDQVAFAELIESRAIDIHHPSSAEMLDIAQTFEAKTNVDFKSGEVLASGERKLTYNETTTAKAGETGSVDIPKEIHLALIPFEGADAYKVVARFRYRITSGRLALGVVLERPNDILREAFEDVVQKAEEAIQHPILRGSGR